MKDSFQDPQDKFILKPQIIKINRFAFWVVCIILVMIVAVIAFSVVYAGKVAPSKVNYAYPSIVNDTIDKDRWYNHIPDQLPRRKALIDNAKSFEIDEDYAQKNTLKKRNDSLQAALESSIKASNIGNTIPPTSSAILPSENSQQISSDYLHEFMKKPLSPYEVKAGTVIPAVLAGGIISDLPGQLTALVSQNVYDSVSGRFLLIPQGAKLILQYDSRITYGQQRLLVAVKRLIFPNGDSLDLQGMPASDSGGYAGFTDEIDNHYSRIFGSSVIMGLITGGFEMSQSSKNNNATNPSASEVMSSGLGQQMAQVTLGMMNKNLDIQPTIKINPGYEFNVTVTSDLVFSGYYRN